MALVALQKYFQVPACQLAALKGSANQAGLSPAGNLDIYDQSFAAFYDPANTTPADSFQRIYGELAGPNWSVFRPQPISACWEPMTVFNTIKSRFQAYSWDTSLTLMDFGARNREALELLLPLLREIKPNKGYPIMTVSKFLHFYNPGLFPIYDTEMVWKSALNGSFRNEYRAFGQRFAIPSRVWSSEDTVQFLPWYMCFANDLLSSAHPAFMAQFAEWLGAQPGANLGARRGQTGPTGFKAECLYAMAFEYTLLGAACL